MKVLIVDDEAYAVNALTNRIDWNGFGFGTPFSARSMAQAQSVFLNEKIDLLLCDIEMPQGSGLDLFEWVKAYYPQTEYFCYLPRRVLLPQVGHAAGKLRLYSQTGGL